MASVNVQDKHVTLLFNIFRIYLHQYTISSKIDNSQIFPSLSVNFLTSFPLSDFSRFTKNFRQMAAALCNLLTTTKIKSDCHNYLPSSAWGSTAAAGSSVATSPPVSNAINSVITYQTTDYYWVTVVAATATATRTTTATTGNRLTLLLPQPPLPTTPSKPATISVFV